MSVSRRQFFKGLGAAMGMVGLRGFLKGGMAVITGQKWGQNHRFKCGQGDVRTY